MLLTIETGIVRSAADVRNFVKPRVGPPVVATNKMASGCKFGIPWPEYNAGVTYYDKIAERDQIKTLLEFYCIRHKNSASAKGWLQRITNGQIKVDGEVNKDSDAKLRTGALLEYHRIPWKEPPAPHELEVLYEDAHMVAINKPAGLQVLPAGLFQERTVLTQLQWRDNKNNEAKPPRLDASPAPAVGSSATSPVHRLGRGTSGLLLCAKTTQAKSRIAADLAEATEVTARKDDSKPSRQTPVTGRERRFRKTYRALASGLIEANQITITEPIGRVRYPGVAGGLFMASPTGKPSLSHVLVLQRNVEKNCTLVQVEILTGRPHQIRIHLASIGHPLLGDPLYVVGGQARDCPEGNQAEDFRRKENPAEDGGYFRPSTGLPGDIGYLLHAWRLDFFHPISEKKLILTAPPPPALRIPAEKGE